MNILIISATNSGSTGLVSNGIAEVLRRKKNVVTEKKARNVEEKDLAHYETIIFGSPSWDVQGTEGSPHETILELLERLKNISLTNNLVAVYGCGDSSYTYFCGAVDHMQTWVHAHGGREILPPLRIDGYYFDLKKNRELVEAWAKELGQQLKKYLLVTV